jgi:DNA-binding NarL/FixJ family response regulator
MSTDTREVWLVGRRRFQDELLCLYLEGRLGCRCRHIPLQAARPEDLYDAPPHLLILIDCTGTECEPLLRLLRERGGEPVAATIALINVDITGEIEQEALTLGVRGFFYHDDPGETFIKGVESLFSGELWLSRRKMESILLNKNRQPLPLPAASALTRREEEILALVASGAPNSVIAERLCISPHTVRTHVYKIFQKIEVPNRFQAALWAAQNL